MTEPSPAGPAAGSPAALPSMRSWRGFRQLGPAGILGLITLTVPPIGAVLLLTQLERVAEPLRQNPWGAVISAVAFGMLGGLALLPTAALAIFAGWAFGFGVGFATAVAGFTFASTIGYSIARRFTGRTVLELINKYPRWRAIHIALLHSGSLRTFLIITLLRVPSVPPFALTNVALATLHVRILPYLLGTAVGVMPRTAAYVWLASQTVKLNFSDTGGWRMLLIWSGLTILVIVLLTILARRALARVTAEEATQKS